MPTSVEAARAPTGRVAPHPATRVISGVLLSCWVALIVIGLLAWPRSSTFADLEAGVAAGRVTEVRVSPGTGDRAAGVKVVELHWREGLREHTTSVVELRPRSRAPRDLVDGDVTAVVGQPVPWRLRELDPDADVTRLDQGSSTLTLLGWSPPLWAHWAFLGLLLATVWLIHDGPQPRHATRWAWFWLVLLTSPIGPVAYLLMSGVTSRHRPSPASAPRLTGGWGLLLAISAGVVLGAIGPR